MVQKAASYRTQWIFILMVLAVAVLSRIVPHADNFSLIGALTLFVAYVTRRIGISVGLTIGTFILSDFALHFIKSYPFYTDDIAFAYQRVFDFSSFFLIAFYGRHSFFERLAPLSKIVLGSIGASVTFFLISNFGTWVVSGMYSHDLAGLITCYVKAIPFYRNTFLGDLFYSGLFFGSYYYYLKRVQALAKA